MTDDKSPDEVREKAKVALRRLTGWCEPSELKEMKLLVKQLRDIRDYDLMGLLAEAISRRDPEDAGNRRLFAQCLIEQGNAAAAIDILLPLTQLPKTHPEFSEGVGLVGRAYKQIFFEIEDKGSAHGLAVLKKAIDAYRLPFEFDPAKNTWHGVNLVALLSRVKRLGLKLAAELEPEQLAQKIIGDLKQVPAEKQDEWHHATLAEISLGIEDYDAVEANIRAYAAQPTATAFLLGSTLRQFTQVWDLEDTGDRGRGIVAILRAQLAKTPDSVVELSPNDLRALQEAADPDKRQLQAMLGDAGPETYDWWKKGLERAASVGVVRERGGGPRIGTAFLVDARDFGRAADDLLLLTNFHVVNEHGACEALRPQDAEVVFEALNADRSYLIDRILWSSPESRHDACLLRLTERVEAGGAIPFAPWLPPRNRKPRVYIIGHPQASALSFSFQNNELLDHEGPTDGVPQIPGVCRVHYRAPTEVGSSGSPVFNDNGWQVVGLHHMGGKDNMGRLNGAAGLYSANEAVWIKSIQETAVAEMAEMPAR